MNNKTAAFRQHHSEIRGIVRELAGLLDSRAVAADPGPTARAMRALFGKLSVHLAIEDSALYPRLTQHPDDRLRRAAVRFQQEMGGLKAEFDVFRSRWPGPLAISQDPDRFVLESRALLLVLEQRIAREDVELYDLYDHAA